LFLQAFGQSKWQEIKTKLELQEVKIAIKADRRSGLAVVHVDIGLIGAFFTRSSSYGC
jgi:hypothetical protein